MRGKWLAVLGAAAVTITASGGALCEERPAVLEEVVVTATRTAVSPMEAPQSVLVIGRDDLAAAGWRLDEALDRLPGVLLNRAGGPSMAELATVRGSQPGEVLVLLNGRRLNTQQSGWYNLSDLPVPAGLIERVEVLPDSSSALYGAEAMGGVINIITRDPLELPAVSLSGSAGSRRTRGAQVGVAVPAGPLALAAAAGRELSEGWRPNGDAAATRLNLRATLAREEGALEFTADAIRKRQGSPGLESYPTPRARQADDAALYALRWQLEAHDRLSLEAEGYYHRFLREYSDPDWDTRSRHLTHASGIDLRGAWEGGAAGRWAAGAEAGWDSLDSTNDGDHGLDRQGLYLQDELRFPSGWTLVATGRYDRYSIFDDQFSPRLALVWRATGSLTLRGSAARGYRTPTFDDLYWSDAWSRGNPDLKPERSWSYELSAAGRAPGSEWGFDLFLRDVADLINWQDRDGDWVYSPENIASARVSGAVLSLGRELPGGVLADLSWSLLHPENRDTGEVIPGRARHQVKGSLKVPCRFLEACLAVAWIDRYPAPNLEKESYWTSSLLLSRTLGLGRGGEIRADFTVDNLFNQGYQVTPGYPMPGRAVNLSLAWEF